MPTMESRRHLLTQLGTASVAGAGGLLPLFSRSRAAEEPLETTSVWLIRIPAICLVPQFVAHQLLLAEGFTDIRYIDAPSSARMTDALAKGTADFTQHFVTHLVTA